ncbi:MULTISPECIES: MipA/OmpV family protein [unclassified Sphingomonas]|uniref:MipA/OmpV family protein n=1 Tax=unclassified Sphingomonas TaxID=196159 RepID=UPI00226AB753|nr:MULTISPECIES: MipA/OmpV family protein [unclassified Sphingomonas]
MRRSTFVLFAAASAALLAPAAAMAQDSSAGGGQAIDLNANRVTVGAGVATVPSYDGSRHNEITGIVQAQGVYDGYAFAVAGTQFSLDLIRNAPGPVWDFQLGPVVSLNFNRVSRIDDARVEALGKKKLAVELGGFVGIGKTGVITSPYDKLSVNVTYVHDVTNIYDSYVVTPTINYGTPLSTKAYVALSGSANYAGRGYAQSYFGVDAFGSARSGLPVFNANKGWKNYNLTALGNYSITGTLLHGLSVVGGVSYSHLMNDFAASPLVSIEGSRNNWYGALGLAYTF